jgi:hypothetical protein
LGATESVEYVMHSVNAFLFPCHFSSAALHRLERGQLTRGRNAALPVRVVGHRAHTASPTALSRIRSHGRFSTRPYLRFCAVSRRLWCTRNGVNPRCEHISDSRLVSAQSQLPKAARTRARLPTSDSGQLYHPYGRSVPSNSAWRGRGSAGRVRLSQALRPR